MSTDAINPITATPISTRVIVANYTTMAVTMIICAARVATSFKWKRRVGLDDVVLFLALCTGITQSALTEHAVRRGLGGFIRPGNSSRLKSMEELVYSADLFFLITVALTNFATVLTIQRFASPSALARTKPAILHSIIGGWSTFSVLAIAFQCRFPYPWLYTPDRCVGSGALWYPVIIISIFINGWLSVCIWPAMPLLILTSRQRQIGLGLYAFRFVTCVFLIALIGVLAPALKDINQPRALPNPTVMKTFVQNTSIVATVIPMLFRALATHSPVMAATVTSNQDAIINDRKSDISDEIKLPRLSILHKITPESKKESTNINEREVDSNDDFSRKLALAFNKEMNV